MSGLSTDNPDSHKAALTALADFLQSRTEPTAIIGNKGIETGIALKLYEIDSENKVIDGLNIAGYAGTRREYKDITKQEATVGLGLGKYIQHKKIEIAPRLWITQPVKDFFTRDNLNVGAGLSIRF